MQVGGPQFTLGYPPGVRLPYQSGPPMPNSLWSCKDEWPAKIRHPITNLLPAAVACGDLRPNWPRTR
jgi:hypothetical protein